MYLKNFLRNQSGMSLTEVMVGVGLMAGVSVVTMRVMQDNAKNDAFLKWTANVNQAALEVQNSINNPGRCTEMLVGELVDSASWPNQNPTARVCGDQASGASGSCPNALRIKAGTGYKVLLRADTEYAEGFYIPPYGIQLATSPNGAAIAELIITFKTRNRDLDQNNPTIKATSTAGKSGQIIKRIPFIIEKDPLTNRIKSCGQVVSDADVQAKEQLCASLGSVAATWDPVEKTCTLNDATCPDGQIPVELSSLGKVICEDINSPTNLSRFFDFSSANCTAGQAVTLVSGADGKIRATCVGNTTQCPAMNVSWNSTVATFGNSVDAACSASLPTAAWNTTANAIDSSSPTTGSAAYRCDQGRKTWVVNGSSSCIDNSKTCASQVVRWSGTTKFCEATAASMNHGATATVTDPSSSGMNDDTASVECSNGKISIIGTIVDCD